MPPQKEFEESNIFQLVNIFRRTWGRLKHFLVFQLSIILWKVTKVTEILLTEYKRWMEQSASCRIIELILDHKLGSRVQHEVRGRSLRRINVG